MIKLFTLIFLSLIPVNLAFANETAVSETAYIFNTFLLLFCGVLVMFMAAGFAMLEAGMVRSKSVAVILTKNILPKRKAILFVLLQRLNYTDIHNKWVHR